MKPTIHLTANNQITLIIDKRDPDEFDNEVELDAAMSPEEALGLAESLLDALTGLGGKVYRVEVIDVEAMHREHLASAEREALRLLPEV